MNHQLLERYMEHELHKLQPAQIATLDYLLKVVIDKKENVLVYHLMGTGKTLLALTFAMIIAKDVMVYVIVPSENVMANWKQQLAFINKLVPGMTENIGRIAFHTTISFESALPSSDSVCIVDEAHKVFNSTSISKFQLRYVLLTGTPFTNTVKNMKNIVSFLVPGETCEVIEGKRIYEARIEDKEIARMRNMKNLNISYYELHNAPKFKFNGKKFLTLSYISCPMSGYQMQEYKKVIKRVQTQTNANMMFSKELVNTSFCAVGNPSYNKKQQVFGPGISGNMRLLRGSAFKNLDISSKFKYLRPKLLDNSLVYGIYQKHFVYFENSAYGTWCLQSFFESIGAIQWNNFSRNKDVYCRVHNKVHDLTDKCKPLKYAIITHSTRNTKQENIMLLIEKYNSGEIDILCGSKIISEAYTLFNTKHIWILTIPPSSAELDQTIARAVRKHAQDKPIVIEINILVATIENEQHPPNFKECIKLLDKSNLSDPIAGSGSISDTAGTVSNITHRCSPWTSGIEIDYDSVIDSTDDATFSETHSSYLTYTTGISNTAGSVMHTCESYYNSDGSFTDNYNTSGYYTEPYYPETDSSKLIPRDMILRDTIAGKSFEETVNDIIIPYGDHAPATLYPSSGAAFEDTLTGALEAVSGATLEAVSGATLEAVSGATLEEPVNNDYDATFNSEIHAVDRFNGSIVGLDMRKLIYIELKRENIRRLIDDVFKYKGEKNSALILPKIHPRLMPILTYYETLIYIKNKFKWNKQFLITEAEVKKYAKKVDTIVYENTLYRLLDENKNEWAILPILFQLPKFVIVNNRVYY